MIRAASLTATLLACLAGTAPAHARTTPDIAQATLRFQSKASVLAGISYGIDAVDARRSVLGERLQAEVPAGLRTIWYSCPGEAAPREGARISFAFEAGASYTLSCRAGQDAEITRSDDC